LMPHYYLEHIREVKCKVKKNAPIFGLQIGFCILLSTAV